MWRVAIGKGVYAWLINDTTSTYVAELMGESFSLGFLRMTDMCRYSCVWQARATSPAQTSIAYMLFFSAERRLYELTPADAI